MSSASVSTPGWSTLRTENIRARLGESIVRLQVAQMIKGLDKEVRDLVLNPNEDDLAEEGMGNLLKVYNRVISQN